MHAEDGRDAELTPEKILLPTTTTTSLLLESLCREQQSTPNSTGWLHAAPLLVWASTASPAETGKPFNSLISLSLSDPSALPRKLGTGTVKLCPGPKCASSCFHAGVFQQRLVKDFHEFWYEANLEWSLLMPQSQLAGGSVWITDLPEERVVEQIGKTA